MRSHMTPLIMTLAISALSASAFAQQPSVLTEPGQSFAGSQPTTLIGSTIDTQTTVLTDVRVNQVLGLPTSHCGHVIDLLHANRFRQGCGQLGDLPGTCSLPHEVAGSLSGDLALGDVVLVSDGTSSCGPVFDIALCNHSQRAIGSFGISIVGILGRIHVHSPTTTVRVSGMNAGQELHVQMTLPLTCMSMGPAGNQPAPFDTLVVAIDSFDEWVERDELNNVRIINRLDIGLLVTETQVSVTETESTETLIDSTTPAPLEAPPSSEDSFDLDDLDLGEADESAIRFGDALR